MFRSRDWVVTVILIVAGGALLAGAAGFYWSGQYAEIRQHYVAGSSSDARFIASRAESAFSSIYQNIRTIALLPSIRSIDRHGTTLSEEAKTTIQQIYNNLATDVDVSEVYVLPVDFDPEKLDPSTGHHEAPILAFDQLIAPAVTPAAAAAPAATPAADATSAAATPAQAAAPAAAAADPGPSQDFVGLPDDAGLPQVEIAEYRRLRQQLAWLSANYPTLDKIDGMKMPMIGSPELITCDNSEFDKTRNDADRMGLVQLVPFYGPDGKLRGGVAAIMRSNAYRALLPATDYALVNTGYGFSTRPSAHGQEAASAQWVAKGIPDPNLIYSEAVPLHTPDSTSKWVLWAGHPDADFTASSEAQNLRNSMLASFLGIGVLVLAALGVAFLIRRNLRSAAAASAQLEARVADRTAEISQLAAAAAAESDRRLASMTETASLNAGIAEVVRAALDGDFSRRLDVQPADAALAGLAAGVNSLIETVDRGVTDTGEVLAALADTDLTRRVKGQYKGVLGRLQDDTNAVADRLTEVILQLRGASGAVRTVTGELLQGANDLSERTSRQAAGLEEASAAIEKLDAATLDIARQAGAANARAGAVARTAGETGDVMTRANEAMGRISAASAKIGNVIGLIDDIAFQTNLLALNASVEAARAGDAGKGFAVVAVEVRRLAQSAAEASAQVKSLVALAEAEVADGNRLVADATLSLDAMLDGIRENSDLVGNIAHATREQSTALSELSLTVRQIDEMTQHNAALVEETNAAIEQTEAQANELDRLVEVFVVDGQTAAPERPRRVA